MPKFFLLSRLNIARHAIIANRWWLTLRLHTLLVRVILLGAIVATGIVYLGLTNTITTTGFQVDQLTKQTEELRRENHKLQLDVARFSTLATVEKRGKELGLVSTQGIEYLNTETDIALQFQK
ncbi:MAG: hypothetical protein A3B74_01220 [Candidatus Kerfeldbacteria bacterium RIFCSPHIGHO2_02_FULL_42_14]|uniref:Cell division protein FtsL n=1 Tax=Candidatus Kerfeldbacteria bacterium RIFCSPHIGHO2_02_FULL_42_14 TaxID=1798540 RepID=A0A1G2AN97_9BACT|nr:MAG: hypothetical protein A3B74_01220 [Candidatus Kerfeldbacteria bacterium RIFCSPHIGHO2_02_FULL_42_14]OGY81125.1 MAG: hypothetical protein A3E60_04685 [Candidatus Kerfeldbacteria bacterium RIFCSPHIGHO2_12_FULL_42_13]OGY84205.1 MAG: hypothetical protein A3I91_05410 [Candidatus Kerfeldbacteria bacterium RIFCSPLOWO2_02_FULL_42_19]OGY87480.1 MAG: hypothetical protein A3G01_02400 [Candidatus Kerfeldbacteria bacterium RIFCSPLOWO2_12_FULL_43_9]